MADNTIILELKTKFLRILKEKFHPHLLHQTALVFHPKLKSLKLLDTETEKADVRNEIRRLINKQDGSEIFSQDNAEETMSKIRDATVNKKTKNQS